MFLVNAFDNSSSIISVNPPPPKIKQKKTLKYMNTLTVPSVLTNTRGYDKLCVAEQSQIVSSI